MKAGALVDIFGIAFEIDGSPVAGLNHVDDFVDISNTGETLTVTMSDDSVMSFDLADFEVGHLTRLYLWQVPGDYNRDGLVDGGDLNDWETTLGGTLNMAFVGADGDGDGRVTGSDFLLWQRNFGRTGPSIESSQSISVPEPSTLLLAAMVLAIVPYFLRRCSVACAMSLCLMAASTGSAQGPFDIAINIPPDVALSGIGSSTQVNLFDGGELPLDFNVGLSSGVNTNAELNLFGGSARRPNVHNGAVMNIHGGTLSFPTVHNGGVLNLINGRLFPFAANPGSTVNVKGGQLLGTIEAQNGSTFNITGGLIGRFEVDHGSIVNIHGGQFDDIFDAHGVVNISGGDFSTIRAFGGELNISGGVIRVGLDPRILLLTDFANVSLSGGYIEDGLSVKSLLVGRSPSMRIVGSDFRIDGVLVDGLETIGSSRTQLPSGVSVTGILRDGRPFAFGDAGDFRASGFTQILTVERAEVPPSTGPSVINANVETVPEFIREGQTLNVNSGGSVGDNFSSGWGSHVTVTTGGVVGQNFEATGTNFVMTGGSIGAGLDLYPGTVASISGGEIGPSFESLPGSSLRIENGTFAEDASFGGNDLIEGGEFGDGIFLSGDHVVVTGGVFGTATASSAGGSLVEIKGGSFSGQFTIFLRPGGEVKISGGSFPAGVFVPAPLPAAAELIANEFLLDGEPIDGLSLPGDSVLLPNQSLLAAEMLSGEFTDGNSFAFGTQQAFARAHSLRLTLAVPEPSCLVLVLASLLPISMQRAVRRYR